MLNPHTIRRIEYVVSGRDTFICPRCDGVDTHLCLNGQAVNSAVTTRATSKRTKPAFVPTVDSIGTAGTTRGWTGGYV
jgi:hypothetical protein